MAALADVEGTLDVIVKERGLDHAVSYLSSPSSSLSSSSSSLSSSSSSPSDTSVRYQALRVPFILITINYNDNNNDYNNGDR